MQALDGCRALMQRMETLADNNYDGDTHAEGSPSIPLSIVSVDLHQTGLPMRH
jgi:hypothetical protein